MDQELETIGDNAAGVAGSGPGLENGFEKNLGF